ncbi:MAG TPA: hypothetical protein VIN59_02915 [Alphaproteobacteria bacterium]
MAVAFTPNASLGSFFTRSSSTSNVNSFLGYAEKSPVQQLVEAQKAAKEKLGGFMESEDFLRMKAFEISNRIKLMNRMGQTDAVAALEAEGQEVVKKYLALQQKAAADAAAKELEDQVNEKFGLGTNVDTKA